MGSQSDKAVMEKTGEVLREFGVAFEMHVLSAHRKPKAVAEFASQAKANGFQVIIAGAGMAAHLAGAVAANTTLPVIGVPLTSQAGMAGLDALLATAQMPTGVPVATVAIDGAKNAAYLAIQILSLNDKKLADLFAGYKRKNAK